MEEIFGKHFSITEPEAINTVIYKVNKTEKEFLDKSGLNLLISFNFLNNFISSSVVDFGTIILITAIRLPLRKAKIFGRIYRKKQKENILFDGSCTRRK